MKTKNLVEITHWAHVALAEVLTPGDLAVDLTVGNGKDTLFLYNAAGPEGCVVGFDIQTEALESAAALLETRGASVKFHAEVLAPLPLEAGVHLLQSDHANWTEHVPYKPKGIIANLGYLPGGNHEVMTQIPTTLAALKAAMNKMAVGGRLAVVCYVEHPGGREEAEAVEKLFSETTADHHVLRMSNLKAHNAPFLIVVEKLKPVPN